MPSLTLEDCYANAAGLKGRSIVITGAGSGFGRQLSLEFARFGAKLILGDVDLKGLEETWALVKRDCG
jgi:NAD(P)-dependent dehydrogenase (short-subunit alcohol dehydrogenase family)